MPEVTDLPPAPPPGPTLDDRLRAVRALQADAARQPDPLLANLGFLTGDLMDIAHRYMDTMQAALAAGGPGPAGDPRLARFLGSYLQLMRHVERSVALESRLKAARPDGPPATGVRRWSE